jgi:hypothetical protein
MKVWVEKNAATWTVHTIEPTERIHNLWQSKGPLCFLESIDYKALFHLSIPMGNELYEIDLSGTKPKLVCIWVPVR